MAIYLPHLTPRVAANVEGSKLPSFLIALEAWRRGLTVTVKHKKFFHYSITYQKEQKGWKKYLAKLLPLTLNRQDKVTYSFYRGIANIVPPKTLRAAKDKDLAKLYLSRVGISVPEGKKFAAATFDGEVLAYARDLGYPVVIKPAGSSGGKGVFTNIKNGATLQEYLAYLKNELNVAEFLVEKHINGDDFRAYVLGDRVLAVTKRIPANVVGNGFDTIQQLIAAKNEQRKKNPSLRKGLIKIDKELLDYIQGAGYNLDSVLEEGKQLFLRGKSNVLAGGDMVDVTDEAPDSLKETAVRAVKPFPGLIQAGVDIIADFERKQIVVNEINSIPAIGLHIFPGSGQARDIPSAIIDYYFPESCRYKNLNRNVYFDVKKALKPLKDGKAKEITIAPAPSHKIKCKKILISGEVQGVGFEEWVQRQARKLNLSGFIKLKKDRKLMVVVAGRKKNIVKFTQRCLQGPKAARVFKVESMKWKKPVMIGFKIFGKKQKTFCCYLN